MAHRAEDGCVLIISSSIPRISLLDSMILGWSSLPPGIERKIDLGMKSRGK
jgi:hypothetical protein